MSHTKKCLSYAIICAIENARDREDWDDEEFLAFVTRLPSEGDVYGDSPYGWAIGYLSDQTLDCKCYKDRGAGDLMTTEEFHKEVERMQAIGFTTEAAWNHLDGLCDTMICGACNA